jgi:hypothetical protein
MREAGLKKKRSRAYPPRSWSESVPQEPGSSPFNDMFGTPEDIFADVLAGEAEQGRRGGGGGGWQQGGGGGGGYRPRQ